MSGGHGRGLGAASASSSKDRGPQSDSHSLEQPGEGGPQPEMVADWPDILIWAS